MRTQITGTNIGAQQRIKGKQQGEVGGAQGTRTSSLIHIVDGQSDDILDVIGPDNIIYENHHKSLEDLNETFTFKATTDGSYMEHIVKGNRVLIPHEDNESLVEFTIEEVEDVRGLGQTIEVHSIASFLSLRKSKVVRPETATYTAQQWVAWTTQGSEYIPGVIESVASRKMTIENHTSPYNFLRTISREFDLEVDFTVEHNGIKVTQRYCNMYDRVGMWRGREITFGQDLKRVVRKESGDVYTALLGVAPADEDGNRMEVLVEDDEALQRWGRPGPDGKLRHLIGVYEPESDREDMSLEELRRYTLTELNKRNRPMITFEVDFVDLENVMGEESKKVRFGDTLRIKDTAYEPNIYIEARVFEVNRSIFNFRDKEIVLGDFVEFQADMMKEMFYNIKNGVMQDTYTKNVIDRKDKKVASDTTEYTDEEISKLRKRGEFDDIIVRKDSGPEVTYVSPADLIMRDHVLAQHTKSVGIKPGEFSLSDNRFKDGMDIKTHRSGFAVDVKNSSEVDIPHFYESLDWLDLNLGGKISTGFGKLEVDDFTLYSKATGDPDSLPGLTMTTTKDVNKFLEVKVELNASRSYTWHHNHPNYIKEKSLNVKDIVKLKPYNSLEEYVEENFPGEEVLKGDVFKADIPDKSLFSKGRRITAAIFYELREGNIPRGFGTVTRDGILKIYPVYIDGILSREYWLLDLEFDPIDKDGIIGQGLDVSVISFDAYFSLAPEVVIVGAGQEGGESVTYFNSTLEVYNYHFV